MNDWNCLPQHCGSAGRRAGTTLNLERHGKLSINQDGPEAANNCPPPPLEPLDRPLYLGLRLALHLLFSRLLPSLEGLHSTDDSTGYGSGTGEESAHEQSNRSSVTRG
jgi:hypothetical protein